MQCLKVFYSSQYATWVGPDNETVLKRGCRSCPLVCGEHSCGRLVSLVGQPVSAQSVSQIAMAIRLAAAPYSLRPSMSRS